MSTLPKSSAIFYNQKMDLIRALIDHYAIYKMIKTRYRVTGPYDINPADYFSFENTMKIRCLGNTTEEIPGRTTVGPPTEGSAFADSINCGSIIFTCKRRFQRGTLLSYYTFLCLVSMPLLVLLHKLCGIDGIYRIYFI